MRARKKSPIFSAKANGQVIRRCEVTLSVHQRTRSILRELGGDSTQILRELKWERMCRQSKLAL